MIPPQKQMTGMLGHPVDKNPIARMFDAVYAHHGLNRQFWKNDIADEHDLALAVAALRPLGSRGMTITVPWRVAVIPLPDGVPAEWQPWQSPVSVPPGTTLLMNATHLGCAPEREPVPLNGESVDRSCTVVDVITNPRITPFLQTARERGCPIVDGVEMLVRLAMQIFERWTGITPEEAVFQAAVAEALGEV